MEKTWGTVGVQDNRWGEEMTLNRSRQLWEQHGRSKKWIEQRMREQETRNKLTDYWKESGVKEGEEYAILTNIIHTEWAGV